MTNNVHPLFLESLLTRLPAGAKVVEASANTLEKAVFTIETVEGLLQRVSVDKVDVVTYLGGQTAEAQVEEGDSWESVMLQVSEKYRLFLVPGVDYEIDSGKVEFSEGGQTMKGVAISPGSVSLSGVLSVNVRCKTRFNRPTIAVCCALDDEKTQTALVSKIFPTYDVIVIGGSGSLPAAFSGLIHDHLTDLGVHYIPSLADLVGAEVVDLLNDGVSDIVVLKTVDEHLWFVRYRLLSASEESSTG